MKILQTPTRALAFAAKAAAVAAVIVPLAAGQSMAASVGLTWKGKSQTTNIVVDGFLKRMAEAAPDVPVEVKGQQADDAALGAVISAFDASKDAIVVMRSSGAKFLHQQETTKPGFFGGVTNPVELGVIKNMAQPEGNLTGVSQLIPHATSVQAFMTIMPNMTKLTLLLQKGHPAASGDREGTEAACAKFGLTCEVFEAESLDDLLAKAAQVSGEGQAIVLGSQTLINNNAAKIVAAAPKTPVFTFNERAIKGGATAGLVADLSKLGRQLADKVLAAVRDGKAIKDIPVGVDEEPKLVLNMTSVQRLGITISPDILNSATIVE